jgi:hypothetical protein
MALGIDPGPGLAELQHFTARGRLVGRRNVLDFPPRAAATNCPELDCVRRRLGPRICAMAERRAAELGTGADRVLITAETMSEDAYLAALAGMLGIEFETLDERPRDACPLGNDALIEAAATGLLPLIVRGQLTWVIAPRNLAARRLIRFTARHSQLAHRIRLTSTARLNRFIAVHCYQALGRRADRMLHGKWPDLSAAPHPWRLSVTLAAIAFGAPAALVAFPTQTTMAAEACLAVGFLAWLLLRLVGSFIALPLPRPACIPEQALPVYTLIIALYHEAEAVDGLIEALRELDYPPEKLDIKLVIETDDMKTWTALSRLRLAMPFEIVTAPNIGPRTKPKALNAALPFARGTFTAVYDAEDRPEPDQLRRVLGVFHGGSDDLACVQARLTIDNTADNWLARLFTAEYAAQFDLFLPGLAALSLPFPLGGSSNHFRTRVLREVGAWDPYNVTEDADLGMRLARLGYRTTVADSTTYEEAPAQLGPWLRQRTRWFKGWMRMSTGIKSLVLSISYSGAEVAQASIATSSQHFHPRDYSRAAGAYGN